MEAIDESCPLRRPYDAIMEAAQKKDANEQHERSHHRRMTRTCPFSAVRLCEPDIYYDDRQPVVQSKKCPCDHPWKVTSKEWWTGTADGDADGDADGCIGVVFRWACSVGVIFTMLTIFIVVHYATMTTTYFDTTPPSITQQGFRGLVEADAETHIVPYGVGVRVEYKLCDKCDKTYVEKGDRYFEVKFRHTEMINFEKQYPRPYVPTEPCGTTNNVELPDHICMQNGTLGYDPWTGRDEVHYGVANDTSPMLQGTYLLKKYAYVDSKVFLCDNATLLRETGNECARLSDIEDIIAKGYVRVSLGIIPQHFNTTKMHVAPGNMTERMEEGVVKDPSDRLSWLFFALPARVVRNEVYFQVRDISPPHERVLGAPPDRSEWVTLLAFKELQTVHEPFDKDNKEKRLEEPVVAFYLRLYEEIVEEQLSYWIQSLLDLAGMWGGIIALLDITFGSLLVPGLRRLYRWRYPDDDKKKKEEEEHASGGESGGKGEKYEVPPSGEEDGRQQQQQHQDEEQQQTGPRLRPAARRAHQVAVAATPPDHDRRVQQHDVAGGGADEHVVDLAEAERIVNRRDSRMSLGSLGM